jgi:hypothetical protein
MAKLTLLIVVNSNNRYHDHLYANSYKLIIVSIIIVAGSSSYCIELDQ